VIWVPAIVVVALAPAVTDQGADGLTGAEGSEGSPAPLVLVAVTVNVYAVLFTRPLTVQLVVLDEQV
jgi:hypothetical protein